MPAATPTPGAPSVVGVSIDPPLIERGGGIDVTVDFTDAVLLRIELPQGLVRTFPVSASSGTEVLHLRGVLSGEIRVTAVNPAAATADDPHGESEPVSAFVHTYTLPPLSSLTVPDLNLTPLPVQIQGNEVVLGEPALSILKELALLRGGIRDIPAPFPDGPPRPPAPPLFTARYSSDQSRGLGRLLSQLLATTVTWIPTRRGPL